eukprot:CAMPEP_0178938670 /NCGR_PEP_ID=MMETSP0786-20121207/26459_1 /TAXON_ID=186022 /ORGANISM="Thalassionema frauenfeldii, Strain CCMP 1798" /LENGTH=235 /DNA_ID=CAMNT_0020617413 /DNA_START=122 /DNA_END=826 /DNA_ORIENTATION=+
MTITLASLSVLLLASIIISTQGFTTTTTTTPPVVHHPLSMSAEAETEVEKKTIGPIKSLDGTVTLPGSKSLSNRCLLLAALSEGNTKVENLLDSDDIRYMIQALQTLGVPLEEKKDKETDSRTVLVTGQAGPLPSPKQNDDNDNDDDVVELFLGNAGTAMRPLAAALSFSPSASFVLDGVPRMRERPIADLMDGLQQLGANVECVKETGCPPVTIQPPSSSSSSDSSKTTTTTTT